MAERIQEKLQIFVSSTIEECAAERAVAKRAIESLNHDAILFEHIGARSMPPRALYLGKLDQSDIFISIYRNNYGWVAPGSTISGIDDELRRSSQRGMPRLAYVLEPTQDRDPQLTAMLKGVQSEITYSRYRNPEELFERIREDVEAEVTKRFHEAERLEAIVHTDAAAAISGLFPIPKSLLVRKELAGLLREQLSTHYVLQVSGELGIGKTVFLATVAKENNFLFVSGTQLANHELAAVIANKLASARGANTRYFADASTAYSALLEEWRATETVTLIIDDCPDPDFVAAFLKNVSPASNTKRLIYSTRNADPRYGHVRFTVPRLSLAEATELLASHGQNLSEEALSAIYNRSAGNPLYLLYFTQSPEVSSEKSLAEYELDAWRKLEPLARELSSYLAIANQRISLAELLGLVGRRGGPLEEVTDTLQRAQVFVAEFPNGYALRHEHQRLTIREQLSASPSKFAYYSGRVAVILKKRGDYLRAFLVLRQADTTAAESISRPALFDAQRRGDFKSQLVIVDDILESARKRSDPQDLMTLLLSRAQALHHTGRGSELDAVFAEADAVAASSSDQMLSLRAREVRAVYSASTNLSLENLESLQKLEKEYLVLGDLWSAGRLTTELSVLFTRTKRFSEGLAASERGLKIFEDLGDDYGVSVSIRNMASALAETPGREKEATALIERLQEQQQKSGDQRERAWLCNYMVRTLRRKKQFTEALSYGREAVQIGEELGDLNLAGINRLNVGNVLRDKGERDAAIAEYASAGNLGRRSGDKSLEASAARLTAGVYRNQGNNRLALEYAQVAVALVEGSLASTELADALEEVGDCHHSARSWDEAAEFYAKAAAASADIKEKSRLTIDALSTCVYEDLGPDKYLSCLNLAYGLVPAAKRPSTEQFFDCIDLMLKNVHADHAIRLFGLHFRLMFQDLPQAVARFLFGQVLKKFLMQTKEAEVWRVLFPAMPLLASVPEDGLALRGLVQLGDRIQDRISGLHFKFREEGSSWVVGLNLRQPAIVTITCLDDRIDTFTAVALLAMFFKGFEESIAEMLSVPELPKRELDIYVGNIESVPQDMISYFPPDFTTCVVTRPSMPATDSPTFVVCREDIGKQWRAGTGSASAVQGLLGEVLIEVVYQFLRGEVDIDVIKPKVIEILGKTLS
jgi:tetratricopeptide (TPR) repeat protein